MNKMIARFYSNMIEGLHVLFVAALVIAAIYFLNNDSNFSVWHMGIMVLLAIVSWVVIFGFITTVVVISNTLQEIHKQNEIMTLFLKKMAVTAKEAPQATTVPARPIAGEPFIGGNIR